MFDEIAIHLTGIQAAIAIALVYVVFAWLLSDNRTK